MSDISDGNQTNVISIYGGSNASADITCALWDRRDSPDVSLQSEDGDVTIRAASTPARGSVVAESTGAYAEGRNAGGGRGSNESGNEERGGQDQMG